MKIKASSFQGKKQSFAAYFTESIHYFCSSTALHAMKFIGDSTVPVWGRLFFFISFGMVVSSAVYFALDVFDNWQTMPVIISMDSHTTSVTEVPFPAITICNMNGPVKSKAEKMAVNSTNYALLQKFCNMRVSFSEYQAQKSKIAFSEYLTENYQPCEKMLLYCSFAATEKNCRNFFKTVITDEGLCCVFNTLHPSLLYKGRYDFVSDYHSSIGRLPVDWSPETGYPSKLPLYYYPREGKGAGVSLGFSLAVNADIDEYFCSSTNGAGFKISVHNPIDAPNIKDTGLPIEIGAESRMRVTPRGFEAVPSLRDIEPKKRQCYFNNEKELAYFKYYSHRNCEMECDSDFMYRQCHCIPFNMPMIYDNVAICHVENFDCMVNAERTNFDEESLSCREECLQSCDELYYYSEVTAIALTSKQFNALNRVARNLSKEFLQENVAIIHIYLKEPFYRNNVRSPYTRFTDYLSQTGGIMSLMMGFGFISIAEVLHFVITRPILCYLFKRPLRKVSAKKNSSKIGKIAHKQQDTTVYRLPSQRSKGIAKEILSKKYISKNIQDLKGASNFHSEYKQNYSNNYSFME